MNNDVPKKIDAPRSGTFDLDQYVEAANDASNRSRYVSVILVAATILILVGLNNEYMNSWMVDDLREVYRPGDQYVHGLLEHRLFGDTKADADYFRKQCDDKGNCVSPADKAKSDAQEALMKTHMEGRSFLKIPILGVSIHVNDLGLIGGITLIVLLLLARTSLSREIKNLNYSFKKSYEAGYLDEFYDALAMRQLFTVPHMKGEKRNHFLSKTPYVVCLFPVGGYLWLVAYDILTVFLIPRYRKPLDAHPLTASILWIMIVEGICVAVISFIAFRCVERQYYIYTIWDAYWKLLKPVPELCLLESTVAARLQRGKDYSVVEDELDKQHIELSEQIITNLKKLKTNTIRPGNLYIVRWLLRALKEETAPIFRFFPHMWSVLVSKRSTEKPLLITIGPDLAELFSNDKEINDTLRKLLNEQAT